MHKIVILLLLANLSLQTNSGEYRNRFLTLYDRITNPLNGYYSKEGVPYHSIETLLVESTDYGHETDSEAFSYNVYLKAIYGAITGDFQPFNDAWNLIDSYMIPTLQPNSDRYNPASPISIDGIAVGQDPIFNELKTVYNTTKLYIMHWLSDVDNIYGFGNRQGECESGPDADGPSFIHLGQGSLWQGFNTPTCDNWTYGGEKGFQFTNGWASKAYSYAAGPDADARAIQAAYWASQWAQTKGKLSDITDTLAKAAKLGDFLRYTMFEQNFKKIGNCIGKEDCPGVSDKSSAHYLISWGISWGGSLDKNGYHWRVGNSVCYYGYQNLVAAHGLLNEATMRPKGATALEDWQNSLDRQLELYEYLQTSQGAFAAGVTNSYNKNYDDPPQEYKDHAFHGMWFDYQPGYADANPWFGFQPWTADRVAQYYYITGNERAKNIISKWVSWIISEIRFEENGDFTIPTNLKWEGLPPETVVTITGRGYGANTASCTARTLAYYAARSGDHQAKEIAKKILDGLWNFYQSDKGYANVQVFTEYKNFNNPLYLPLANWTGVYPNGDMINSNSTFLSVRSWFKKDPNWDLVQNYLDGGEAPSFEVHRFWENADLAISLAVYDMLFNE